jgi:hypothetical protein
MRGLGHAAFGLWPEQVAGQLVGRGRLTARSKNPVKPVMTHLFYMDEADPSKVSKWLELLDQPRSKARG